MKKQRKILALVCVLVLALNMLYGCGKKDEAVSSGENVMSTEQTSDNEITTGVAMEKETQKGSEMESETEKNISTESIENTTQAQTVRPTETATQKPTASETQKATQAETQKPTEAKKQLVKVIRYEYPYMVVVNRGDYSTVEDYSKYTKYNSELDDYLIGKTVSEYDNGKWVKTTQYIFDEVIIGETDDVLDIPAGNYWTTGLSIDTTGGVRSEVTSDDWTYTKIGARYKITRSISDCGACNAYGTQNKKCIYTVFYNGASQVVAMISDCCYSECSAGEIFLYNSDGTMAACLKNDGIGEHGYYRWEYEYQ